jgi:hypothetical protein
MGLLLPTHEVSRVGVTLADAYVATGAPVAITPDADVRGRYHVVASYGVWASQSVRDEGGVPVETAGVQFAVDAADVSPNEVYAAIYSRIKARFPEGVDVLDP